MDERKEDVKVTAKIWQLVSKGELVPVVIGLYETDAHISGYNLAPIIYRPPIYP